LFSVDIPTPESSANCLRVNPLVSAIPTASLRNSSARFSPVVHLLCCSKCYQRSGTKPRQVHAPDAQSYSTVGAPGTPGAVHCDIVQHSRPQKML
jgi:hypothetical protein